MSAARIGSAGRRCSRFDPETAHGLVDRRAEKRPAVLSDAEARRTAEASRVAGLDFPNPLGMAAGYDKNAEVPDALLGLGFGFAEVGTVTPLPQAGQSEAAHLPADRRPGGDQPAGLQQ